MYDISFPCLFPSDICRDNNENLFTNPRGLSNFSYKNLKMENILIEIFFEQQKYINNAAKIA